MEYCKTCYRASGACLCRKCVKCEQKRPYGAFDIESDRCIDCEAAEAMSEPEAMKTELSRPELDAMVEACNALIHLGLNAQARTIRSVIERSVTP